MWKYILAWSFQIDYFCNYRQNWRDKKTPNPDLLHNTLTCFGSCSSIWDNLQAAMIVYERDIDQKYEPVAKDKVETW